MNCIILKINTYKEKDGIVEAITDEGLITFTVHGLIDPKSKNHALNSVLTVADVIFQDGNSVNYHLKESKVISSPIKIDMSLEYLAAISLIADASNALIIEDERHMVYQTLLTIIEKLKNGVDPYLICVKYLLDICDLTGYSLSFSGCANCDSKKDIVAFSFSEGGYICRKCMSGEVKNDLTIDQMILIRKIKAATNYDFNNITFIKGDAIAILNKFYEFAIDAYGVELKAVKYIS